MDTAANAWQIDQAQFPRNVNARDKLIFLLRYAILAPSTRNTQPWKFRVGDDSIDLYIDLARWQRVSDDDQRELHLSAGCALENLLIAAEYFGYGHAVRYCPQPAEPTLVANVRFSASGERSAFRADLFDAIAARCTDHDAYEQRAVPNDSRDLIQHCCVESDLALHLTDDAEVKRKVDALIARADALEFADPAYRDELAECIGQGNFGTPWLVSVMGQLAMSYLNLAKSTTKKDHEILLSAPLLGVISSKRDDRTAQIRAGQLLARIALSARLRGLSVHPMSQIVQLPEIRAELARLNPPGDLVPQQPFRLGFSKKVPRHTPRRAIEEVLI